MQNAKLMVWVALVLGASACGDDGGAMDVDAGAGPQAAAVSGAKVPFTAGEAMDVPDTTWTYVHFPEAICRDGSETGLAINVNPDSDELLILMEGGGACFNQFTCLTNGGASSWGESDMSTSPAGALDRSAADNPFKDWNMVYLPYCTGDVFTGSAQNGTGHDGYTMQGYINVGLYLERIVPTFPNLKRVVLSGRSAGGFGAAWNYLRTQDAFGDIPVDTLDDSGPPMGPDYLTECLQARLAETYGWSETVHPACEDCDIEQGTVVRPLMELVSERQKERSMGLLSYDEDGIIKTFFAYGLDECANYDSFIATYPTGMYPDGLEDLRQLTSDTSNFRIFEVSGGGHTFLGGRFWEIESGGVNMGDWVDEFLTGGSGFVNVTP